MSVGYEKQWADQNKQRNRGCMDILMSMDMNANYDTPRPASRVGVSSEAKDILERNRGGTGAVFGLGNSSYMPRKAARVNGDDAAEIHNLGRNGTVSSVLNTSVNKGYYSARPAPRVKVEAEDIADKNLNGTMGFVLNNEKNRGYNTTRGVPRVTNEGGDNATKGKGTMNVILDSSKNKNYYTTRGQPRVKPEAEDIAIKNKGTMGLVLSSNNKPQDQPAQRVKPEASDSYNKNRGTLTNIYSNYGKLPGSARKEPKVKGEGQEIQHHGTKGTLCHLLNKYGNLPKDSRAAPRVKPEARQVAKKGQGSIGDLLGTQGNKSKTYISGRKSAMW